MKKFFVFTLIIILTAGVMISCSQKKADKTYKDGVYFKQEDSFSEETGWKEVVTLEVEDGKIVSADWNAANTDGGESKKTRSKNGSYGMLEKGGAQSKWYVQAEKAEQFLIEKQDPKTISYNDEGYTDDISGVSIHVNNFFKLAEEALNNDPVGVGPYKDGHFSTEEDQFSEKTGWKETVNLTVVNGYIVAANWNAVHKDGGEDKKTQSKNGTYGMLEQGGAQFKWYVQAEKAEQFLIEKQDPKTISYNDEGYTDDISGVSIHVNNFFKLAEEALQER